MSGERKETRRIIVMGPIFVTFLFFDGVVLKQKGAARVQKKIILCTYEITWEGKKEMIDFKGQEVPTLFFTQRKNIDCQALNFSVPSERRSILTGESPVMPACGRQGKSQSPALEG